MTPINLNERTLASIYVDTVEASVWQSFDDIKDPGSTTEFADGPYMVFSDGSSISVKITVEKA